MPRFATPKSLRGCTVCAAVLIAMLALAGCHRAPPPPVQPPLAGAAIGGPFDLIDQDGRRVTDRDFLGHYHVIYFGYTLCPDICPTDLAAIAAGLKRFDQDHPALAGRIVPVFITVDPERDTPAVLKQYVRAFSPTMIGLTGPVTEIDRVAKEFAIYHHKVPGGRPGAYLVSHSATPYLFGPDNRPLAILPVDDPKTPANEASPEAMEAAIAPWVH